MLTVSVITVNYNQPEVTVELLLSLKKYASHLSIEVILADNAPSKNYYDTFIQHYPSLLYIKNDENLGFAGGNNVAMEKASGQYILLLNNDTEITEGFIEAMISEFEQNSDIGLLSPQINFYENKKLIQYAGFTPMNYLTCRNKAIGYLEKDTGQFAQLSKETGFCHGAAVMCRKENLLKAGLMDENYFLYYEELDWCEKFKKTGKKIWFTGKTKIYHKESVSVGRASTVKTYFMVRNRMLYIRKNTGFFNKLFFSIYYSCIVIPKQTISYMLNKRTDLAKYTLKALFWNFTHLKNNPKLGYPIK
ncbi:MAG: glycosyltransferase family 2 protein [Niabella sp.]